MPQPTPSPIDTINLGSLGWVDITWLLVYLVVLLGVTAYSNLRIGSADAEHYFLGGRTAHWWAIGCSLFASNLGTDHLVGLAGSGASGGIAVGNYEFSAVPALLCLGWVFAPYYIGQKIFTTPEFLEKRFGQNMRIFFTWLTIVSIVLTKISVTIFAGSVVLKEVLGWNMWISSIALLSLTAVYTAIGGLAAVLYTEVIQSVFLLVGSCALLYFGLYEVGGWAELHRKLPEGHFRLLKPLDHDDFPWLGVLFGMPITSIWYWCTDQVMAQRVLATDSPAVSQKGCVMAAWLKLLPMYIMVFPGLIAAALYPKEIQEDSNRAYALLVTRLLPAGWVGIMIAVMLSSFMAALSSCFNSISTVFTLDVYAKLFPDHSQAQLVRVGRAFTVFVAIISLAWLPVIDALSDQLFLYIQGMQVVYSAPIVVVFLAARFMPTLTARTAWITLIVGMTLGVLVWTIQNLLSVAQVDNMGLGWLRQLNILHYSIISFLLCSAILLGCHRLDGPISDVENKHLLSENIEQVIAKQEWAGAGAKGAAVSVLIVVFSLTLYHSLP